ncbi:hypothetical protein ADM96_34065 [Burkholderia sp. ST111]|nr:hypothetical protein ADM96_34065 [Burkholderia sp. ST111]
MGRARYPLHEYVRWMSHQRRLSMDTLSADLPRFYGLQIRCKQISSPQRSFIVSIQRRTRSKEMARMRLILSASLALLAVAGTA